MDCTLPERYNSNILLILNRLIRRHSYIIESILGDPITIGDYGIALYKDYAYLNILEAETINGERLFEKLKTIVYRGKEADTLIRAYKDACAVELVSGKIQSLVNDHILEPVSDIVFKATETITREEYGVVEDIKKGDRVIIINNSPDQAIGLYHRKRGVNHQSFVPYFSIPLPFLYNGEQNPVLYFKNNVFKQIRRNKKNLISMHHYRWIQAKIAQGHTVHIKTSINDMPHLFRMLHKNDLLKNHRLIIINKKDAADAFFEHSESFPIPDRLIIKDKLMKIMYEEKSPILEQKIEKEHKALFPKSEEFGEYFNKNFWISRLVKKYLFDKYGRDLKDIGTSKSLVIAVHTHIKNSRLFSVMPEAKHPKHMPDKIEETLRYIFRGVKKYKTTDTIVGKNYTIHTKNDSLIIGNTISLYFSPGSKTFLKACPDVNRSSSYFFINPEVQFLLPKIQRRRDQEERIRARVINHFEVIADRENAEKLMKVTYAAVIAALTGCNFTIKIKKSDTDFVNKTLIKFLTGSFINGIVSIVKNDLSCTFPYAEIGNVLLRDKYAHKDIANITLVEDEGDIELLDRCRHEQTQYKILTERQKGLSEPFELFYATASSLSANFNTIEDIRKSIDELGIFKFIDKYILD